MYRKHFFTLAIALAVLVISGLSTMAQTGPVRGKVLMKQADGTTVPVANAVVDIYRLDLPGKQENIKTNKRGEFNAIGLYIVGKYLFSVSAPNARPKVRGSVKAGLDQEYEIILDPGDGRRLTADEAKKLVESDDKASGTGGGGGGESAEDRAKREELMRKNAEIEASNKKVEETNAIVRRTFEAGRAALKVNKYDEAIAQYNEGLAADPEQPAILIDKSIAHRMRGVDRYNAALQSKDAALKTSGMEEARKDFRAAAEAANKAMEMIKAQPVATELADQNRQKANKIAAIAVRAEAMRLFVTKVDPTKVDDGYAALQELVALQTEPAAKLKAQLDTAQMLFDANAPDKAIAEYQKILAEHPDNVDAMLGAGLALFNTGDTNKYQEAANYLQQFVDKAPDTHALKADAKAVLDELKRQNVKPQKATTGGRRRG